MTAIIVLPGTVAAFASLRTAKNTRKALELQEKLANKKEIIEQAKAEASKVVYPEFFRR